MVRSRDFEELIGSAVLLVGGILAALTALILNPLVLRPRSWSLEFAIKSFALTAISVLLAIGLCSLRKWAAVLFSTFALVVMAYLAATDLSVKEAVLLIPIAATPLAWRRLREASGQFIFGSIVIAVAIGTALQLVTYFVWFRR